MHCSFPQRRFINGEPVYYACGHCKVCQKNKQSEKALRAYFESKSNEFSCFLTLTYSDDNLPRNKNGYPTLSQEQFKGFMKRIRSYYYDKHLTLRYLASGEYSPKMRPHYHICLFGVSVSDILSRTAHYHENSHGIVAEDFQAWKNGGIMVQPFSYETAYYACKYIVKQNRKKEFEALGIEPEFVSQSRRPGLGFDYVNKHKEKLFNDGFIRLNGKKHKIPRYFVQKLLDENEQDEFKARLAFRADEMKKQFWKTHHHDNYNFEYMKEYGEQQEIHLKKGDKN